MVFFRYNTIIYITSCISPGIFNKKRKNMLFQNVVLIPINKQKLKTWKKKSYG